MSEPVLYHAPPQRPFNRTQALIQFEIVLSYLNARRADGSGEVPCIDAGVLLGAMRSMAAVLMWHGFTRDQIQAICVTHASNHIPTDATPLMIRGYIDFATAYTRHALCGQLPVDAASGHLQAAMQHLLQAGFLASREDPFKVAFQVFTGFDRHPLPEQLALELAPLNNHGPH